jgi:hypothetical protein
MGLTICHGTLHEAGLGLEEWRVDLVTESHIGVQGGLELDLAESRYRSIVYYRSTEKYPKVRLRFS